MKNPFKKAIQAVLRRIFGPLFFGLLLASVGGGCAFSARTVGQHDPTVEAIKALTEVIKAQHPTPAPTPSPEGGR